MKLGLLVFARYPEPGRCKTRLIPALGDAGAAAMHERMVHHTLEWGRRWATGTPGQVSVLYAGGSQASMEAKFAAKTEDSIGDFISFAPQAEGNLGEKLECAVRHAFGFTAERVSQATVQDSVEPLDAICIVGTDCPELTEGIIADAFAQLNDHDFCFSPALDGGYTLVGMRNPDLARSDSFLHAAFREISWGTSSVLSSSIERLSSAGATVALIDSHADVDQPEDIDRGLQALDQAIGVDSAPRSHQYLTVIIPAFNEERELVDAIRSTDLSEFESRSSGEQVADVIVAAAGDCAASLKTAAGMQARAICSSPGRARQMNRAARDAQGEVLLFLHADTVLPSGYRQLIENSLRDPNIVGGAFHLAIRGELRGLKLVENMVAWRSRWLKLPYGDQAIFCRKSTFEAMSGFNDLPIMEDYEFVRRLRKLGKIAVLDASVSTSARRWVKLGVLRTTLTNQLMLLGYHLGVSPDRLAQFYRGRKS